MSAPPKPAYAGLRHQRARRDQLDKAQRGQARARRDEKLSERLDELLGPVDEDDPDFA